MSKSKTASKEKGGQLVIRIAKSERAAFIAVCEDMDTTAAREIRRFMREFTAAHLKNGSAEVATKVAATPITQPAIAHHPETAPDPAVDSVERQGPDGAAAEFKTPKKTPKQARP